jgi:hypothetical protein
MIQPQEGHCFVSDSFARNILVSLPKRIEEGENVGPDRLSEPTLKRSRLVGTRLRPVDQCRWTPACPCCARASLRGPHAFDDLDGFCRERIEPRRHSLV